jgi:hypothetical protein
MNASKTNQSQENEQANYRALKLMSNKRSGSSSDTKLTREEPLIGKEIDIYAKGFDEGRESAIKEEIEFLEDIYLYNVSTPMHNQMKERIMKLKAKEKQLGGTQ